MLSSISCGVLYSGKYDKYLTYVFSLMFKPCFIIRIKIKKYNQNIFIAMDGEDKYQGSARIMNKNTTSMQLSTSWGPGTQ